MAAFALCSREGMYPNMAEHKANDGPEVALLEHDNIKAPRKHRKWEPLDLNEEVAPATLDRSAADLNRASIPPHQRRQGQMATPDAAQKPEYIPPHLRKARPGAPLPTPDSARAPEETKDTPNQQLGAIEHRPTALPSPPWSPTPAPVMDEPSTWTQPKGKGRARGGKPPPRTRTVWPKNRDMRPPPPGDESDGGVSFKSTSEGDPYYDVKKLMSWNGDWLPAPVDWDWRKSFSDRHFAQRIENWAIQIDNAYGGAEHGTVDIYSDEYRGFQTDCTEVALRSWIPKQIEGDSPQQYWRVFPSRAPAPLSDVDLAETRPWWEAYPDEKLFLLAPLEVPDAYLDENEYENQLPGVRVSSDEAVRRREFARQERIRKTIARRNRPTVNLPPLTMPDISLKPMSNFYIRPATPGDAQQIAQLYNYYVKNSISANEFNERTRAQMVERMVDIINRGLPWIVAVSRGKGGDRSKQPVAVENVVGFANIDDYCDAGSMYRFTFELELYVHHEYLKQGIGKCMLDQLLSMVNPGYQHKGGYDWINRGDYLKHGCARIVKVINFTYPHEYDKPDDINWLTAFLKTFSFRKGGHLKKVGFKLGKCVDVSIYQYETSETIEADHKPTVPL